MLCLRRLTGTLGQGKPWSHGRRRASTLDPKAVAAFAALEHENWEKAKRFRNGCSVKDVKGHNRISDCQDIIKMYVMVSYRWTG